MILQSAKQKPTLFILEEIINGEVFFFCSQISQTIEFRFEKTTTAFFSPIPFDKTTKWTIRNKDIDDCMKMFQLRTLAYEDAIEWIPFNRLFDVKEIGKGGFGSVYLATWLDGIQKVEEIKVDDDNYFYKKIT